MNMFGLRVKRDGYTSDYDENINAAIVSSFATAAYRFHSLIQSVIELKNEKDQVIDTFDLSVTFNNPALLYRRGAYDLLINGITSQASQDQDNFFTKQVTNHMFQPPNADFGLDLFALNIQRGRDHGIPGYNKWREACGMPKVTNFRQLASIMKRPVPRLLRRMYKSVDDIDLYIAGVAEIPVTGGLVGPTFACILGEQFKRLKIGDRFWYENGNMESTFSEGK